jgi:hypothetical protein
MEICKNDYDLMFNLYNMRILSKPQTFVNISKTHGIATAISETAKWVKHLNSTEQYNPRFSITRQWIENLSDHESISGAEIGVRYGENAAFLLEKLQIGQFYLIDPYDAYEEYKPDWSDEDMTEAERVAKKRLRTFDSVAFIKEYSDDAASQLPGEFDFVYIDGNHDFEYVKSDLELYYPLVKHGGILAGHDYSRSFPGVVEAVDEFAHQHGLKLTEDLWDDWFVKKPINE